MTPETMALLKEWPMGYRLDLPHNSTVVIAGMYKGRVAQLVHELYRPRRIVGFDPQVWALRQAYHVANSLSILVSPDDVPEEGSYWDILDYAIGTQTVYQLPMGEWHTDACSFITPDSREQDIGDMREIVEAFASLELVKVDLCLFNMEGYEYELIPYMTEVTMICNIVDKFAIQFHPSLGNALDKELIFDLMSRTHDVVIDNFPQWVLWDRRR